MRNFLKRILLSLAALIVAGIFCELVLSRVYKKHYDSGVWQAGDNFVPDARLIYALKPNTSFSFITDEYDEESVTDGFGYRNKSINPHKKPPGTFRIVMIGDSFTFGHGLKDGETISDMLHGDLAAGTDSELVKNEVLNTGVPGYTPDQEYRLLSERAVKYAPNLIVWNLISYDLSDLSGPLPALYGLDDSGGLVPLDGRFNWLYIRNKLYLDTPPFLRNSNILDLVLSRLSSVRALRRKPDMPLFLMDDWSRWKLEREIRAASELTGKLGIPLMIVRLPVRPEFEKTSTYPENDFDNYFGYLGSVSQKLNIGFLDVKKELDILHEGPSSPKWDELSGLDASDSAQVMKPINLFFPKDGHPNQSGARVFAAIISHAVTDFRSGK